MWPLSSRGRGEGKALVAGPLKRTFIFSGFPNILDRSLGGHFRKDYNLNPVFHLYLLYYLCRRAMRDEGLGYLSVGFVIYRFESWCLAAVGGMDRISGLPDNRPIGYPVGWISIAQFSDTWQDIGLDIRNRKKLFGWISGLFSSKAGYPAYRISIDWLSDSWQDIGPDIRYRSKFMAGYSAY